MFLYFLHSINVLYIFFQLFLKANVNVSELTDTIISQNYVGSVIKVSDALQLAWIQLFSNQKANIVKYNVDIL